MRYPRTIAIAATSTLVAIGPLATVAAAKDATGVGTANVASTVLAVQLGTGGELLDVRVLGDDGVATIDPAKGARRSASTLRPLVVTSKRVPALNASSPVLTSSSTGPEDTTSVPEVSPPAAAGPAATGKLNAALQSIVDAAGARSGLVAGLANLKLAGGLVSVPTGAVQVLSSAGTAKATGTRSITIPEVRVLELAGLLDGLGISLPKLSITDLLELLKSLGVSLDGIADPAAAVNALNGAIDVVQAAPAGAISPQLCTTVDNLLKDPIGGVGGLVGGAIDGLSQQPGPTTNLPLPDLGGNPLDSVLPAVDNTVGRLLPAAYRAADLPSNFSCTNLVGTVAELLKAVQDTLSELLGGILVELGDTALLTVKDVKVGLQAVATGSVDTSVAEVTASIGEVRVGNLPVAGISGLDLADAAGVIAQANGRVQAAVNGVLAGLNASLADLVKVELLKVTETVAPAGKYVSAASTITAVQATITPPATPLTAAAVPVTGTPVDAVLGGLGTTVPQVGQLMGQLEASLGGLDALRGPATVTVGQLGANAVFLPARAAQVAPGGGDPSDTPTGELPRTGGAAMPAMLAVVLGGAALAIRRVLRATAA